MKRFEWNADKNELLKQERGICFEDVKTALESGGLLDITPHHNIKRYPEQKIFIIQIQDYAYLVPCVEDGEKIFLKTIIPNRDATKKYLKNKQNI